MNLIVVYAFFVFAVPGWTYAINHKLPDKLYEAGWLAGLLSCSFCTGTQVAFWGHLLLTAAWACAFDALLLPLPMWLLAQTCLPPSVGLLAMAVQRGLNLVTAVEAAHTV